MQIERKTIYTCPSKYQFRSQQLFPRSKLKPSSSLILLPFACQRKDNKAMFVSRNSLSGKSLSKLSCVCLPLEKLVNGKHFPVNGKHFPVKEKFGLVSRKMFSLLAVFVCHYKSWSTKNTFQSKENLAWFSGKCFPGKFGRKTLSGKLWKI